MINKYSIYAQDTHLEIQNLNDELQIYMNGFYSKASQYKNSENYEITANNFFIDLKYKIFINFDILNSILIKYINNIQEYYNSADYYRKFQVSIPFEEFVDANLDIININLNESVESIIANDAIIKHINLKIIYNNIVCSADKLNMTMNSTDEIQEYSNKKVLTILDGITSDFYDYIENFKMISIDELNILNVIKNYIFELRVIIYIIEFIESIKMI